jgi:hypothetical protein
VPEVRAPQARAPDRLGRGYPLQGQRLLRDRLQAEDGWPRGPGGSGSSSGAKGDEGKGGEAKSDSRPKDGASESKGDGRGEAKSDAKSEAKSDAKSNAKGDTKGNASGGRTSGGGRDASGKAPEQAPAKGRKQS